MPKLNRCLGGKFIVHQYYLSPPKQVEEYIQFIICTGGDVNASIRSGALRRAQGDKILAQEKGRSLSWQSINTSLNHAKRGGETGG